jgi:formylglycine-generating enzyme required for sulfatase activity
VEPVGVKPVAPPVERVATVVSPPEPVAPQPPQPAPGKKRKRIEGIAKILSILLASALLAFLIYRMTESEPRTIFLPAPTPTPVITKTHEPTPVTNNQQLTTSNYTETHAGVNLEMVSIPGGTFQMGSNGAQAESDEKPVHTVTLDGFWMGKYEVTQRQYEAMMGGNPSYFKGPDRPVEMVSWNDVTEFCQKISQATGKTYSLPTEAQWEYACRAGSSGKWCFGDSENLLGDYGWHTANSGSQTHDVGGKKPNVWGLYDMHGNVWEWCADWYAPYSAGAVSNPAGPANSGSRVIRGGDWGLDPESCRSADRYGIPPAYRYHDIGFRLSRTQK